MKKVINKNSVFSFILGLLLCSGMVYGVNIYNASDILYIEGNGTKTNVNAVINDLYEIAVNKNREIPTQNFYFYDAGGSQANGYVVYNTNGCTNLKINSIGLKNSQAYDWTHFYVYGINGNTETQIYYVHSSVTSLKKYTNVNLDISSYERIKIAYSVFGSYITISDLIIS